MESTSFFFEAGKELLIWGKGRDNCIRMDNIIVHTAKADDRLYAWILAKCKKGLYKLKPTELWFGHFQNNDVTIHQIPLGGVEGTTWWKDLF